MKSILTILCILFSLSFQIASAEKKPNVDLLFAHPKAIMNASGNDWSGHGSPAANFQRQIEPESGDWTFCSGWGSSDKIGKKESIEWHFISTSEYDDLYVLTFEYSDSTTLLSYNFLSLRALRGEKYNS